MTRVTPNGRPRHVREVTDDALAVPLPSADAPGIAEPPAAALAAGEGVPGVSNTKAETGEGADMTEPQSVIAVALAAAVMLARGFGLALWEMVMTRKPDSPADDDEDEVPEREYDLGENGA